MTDPYAELGVPQSATDDEVKKAYRKMAKRYHPDANPGDKAAEQKMKEANAAYDEIINRKNNGQRTARLTVHRSRARILSAEATARSGAVLIRSGSGRRAAMASRGIGKANRRICRRP